MRCDPTLAFERLWKEAEMFLEVRYVLCCVWYEVREMCKGMGM